MLNLRRIHTTSWFLPPNGIWNCLDYKLKYTPLAVRFAVSSLHLSILSSSPIHIFLRNTIAGNIMLHLYSFAIFTYLVFTVDAQCYYPNGTIEPLHFPCNNSPKVESMCCNTQSSDRPDKGNPDGLCVRPEGTDLWRGSCTDRTWQDPACLRICLDGPSMK